MISLLYLSWYSCLHGTHLDIEDGCLCSALTPDLVLNRLPEWGAA